MNQDFDSQNSLYINKRRQKPLYDTLCANFSSVSAEKFLVAGTAVAFNSSLHEINPLLFENIFNIFVGLHHGGERRDGRFAAETGA